MSPDKSYSVVAIESSASRIDVSVYWSWEDALDAVGEAASEGKKLVFFHHIGNGRFEDRTQRALDACLLFFRAEAITDVEYEFIKHHHGAEMADSFKRVS